MRGVLCKQDSVSLLPAARTFRWKAQIPCSAFTPLARGKICEDYRALRQILRLRSKLSSQGIVDSSDFNGGWYAAQRMTREEAVKAFTIWAAYAAFEEKLKGSLESGKLGDFIVLSDDIFQVPVQNIPKVKVEKTLYRRSACVSTMIYCVRHELVFALKSL